MLQLMERLGINNLVVTVDMGRSNIITHTIDTGDARPVRQPLGCHPPAYQVAIKGHVATLLQQGVIEPVNSQWASNIVIVRKKSGDLTVCTDYSIWNF